MSLQRLETWLFEMPLMPIACTRSSTLRVDTPWIQASWTTATSARSAVFRGSRKPGKVTAPPQLRDLQLERAEPGLPAPAHGSRCGASCARRCARSDRRRPVPPPRTPSAAAAPLRRAPSENPRRRASAAAPAMASCHRSSCSSPVRRLSVSNSTLPKRRDDRPYHREADGLRLLRSSARPARSRAISTTPPDATTPWGGRILSAPAFPVHSDAGRIPAVVIGQHEAR